MKTLILFFCILLTTFHLFGQCTHGDWHIVGPIGGVPDAPENGNGRLQAVAIDPQNPDHIYIGSETGGLWRWDEDLDFNTLMNTDQLDRLGIAAIAINPDNNDEIIIATGKNTSPYQSLGYNTTGIYRSTDGGSTWTKELDWKNILRPGDPTNSRENWNGIQFKKIVYNPANTDEILAVVRMQMDQNGAAAYNDGKVYKSTNGGDSWTDITAGNLSDRYFIDMEVLYDGSSTTVYLSSHRLYKSTNFGTSWTDETLKLSGLDVDGADEDINNFAQFLGLAKAPQNSSSTYDDWISVISVNNETHNFDVFISMDNFATTSSKLTETTNLIGTSPSAPGIHNFGFGVNHDFTELYIGGGQIGIFAYETNATTTSVTTVTGEYLIGTNTHPDVKDITVGYDPIADEDYVYVACDGGLYKSISDGTGLDFYDLNDGLEVAQLYAGAKWTLGDYYIAGAQDHGTFLKYNENWACFLTGDGAESNFDYTRDAYAYYENFSFTAGVLRADDPDYTASVPYGTDHSGNIIDPSYDFQFKLAFEISPYDNSLVYVGVEKLNYYDWEANGITSNIAVLETSRDVYQFDGTTPIYTKITDIEISKSNPNIIYMSCVGLQQDDAGCVWQDHDEDGDWDEDCGSSFNWNDPTKRINNLYRSYDGGLTFEDISPEIEGIYGEITAIALTETDGILYIAYSGYESTDGGNDHVFNLFIADEPLGVVSIPLNTGNPNTSVNDIVYQEDTEDRLFIATDKGVYWNEGSGDWECFSNGLPNVVVMDVDIDYCRNKIIAFTYGRGIWESELPEVTVSDPIIISTDVTWDGNVGGKTINRVINNDIIIETGASLTINDGAIIRMAANKKIIVKNGAKLSVKNATITALCSELWQGIEVWGVGSGTAHPSLSSIFTGTYPEGVNDHGVVIIEDGSTISFARNAITTSKYDEINNPTYRGGIILAYNSFFLNNRRSAEFMQYDYSPTNTNDDNISRFSACDFQINDEYPCDEELFAHISM